MTGSLLAAVALLLAPPSLDDLSPLDRQATGFSGAIGTAVAARWVAPTPAAGDVTVSLVVSDALNPAELQRPAIDLSGDGLQVLDAESPARALPGGAVAFDYLVRLRRGGSFELPAVPYVYYRPDRPAGKRFLTAYADPVTVTVRAAESPPVSDPGPPVTVQLHVDPQSYRVPAWAWLVPVVATPPLVVFLRRAIDARRSRRARTRHPAAAHARRRLADATASDDPVGAVSSALHDYLVARHGLPAAARTPREVEAALPGRAAFAAIVSVLDRCDAARFSPTADDARALARAASSAVAAWEGAS